MGGLMLSNCFLRLGAFTGIVISALSLPGQAQNIVSDGSLGTTVETTVDLNGTNYQIGGGTFSPGELDNLFHSFERFNLDQGETATFQNFINNVGVDIIFARVTGGEISTINGTINGGDVNLFLMNPDGLVFNEGASLNIDRSFFGVTADSISFFDDSQFTATSSTGVPTGEVPFSFIFTGDNGDIVVEQTAPGGNAQIEVDVDRTFALIGSNVRISGLDGADPTERLRINAPSGRVEIIGVGSQSFLEAPIFVDRQDNLGISFPLGAFPAGNGQVLIENSRISSESRTDDSPQLDPGLFFVSNATSNFQEDLDAGGVFVRASEAIFVQESEIRAFTASTANAGYVGLQTNPQGNITLSNGNVFATVESADANGEVAPGARGQGGAVIVDTGDLTLKDSSQLQVLVREGVNSPDTFAGTVFVQATGTVSLEDSDQFDFGPGIFASVGSNAQASSGLILMDVGSLEINSVANDDSGRFTLVEASNFGEGAAGVIIIDADNDVVVRGNRGRILSLATNAPDNSDNSFQFQEQSPGFILIGARRVGVLNGAEISATSRGTAEPGRIGIEADLIALNRGRPVLSPNFRPRNSGISAENSSGQGGLIVLDTGFLALANRSSVTTISNFEQGGDTPDNFQGIGLDIDFEVIASPSLDNDIVVDATGTGGSAGIVEFAPGTSPFLRNIAVRDSSVVSNDISFNGEGGASDGALLGEFSEFSSFQPTAEPSPDTVDPSRLIAQGCAAGDLRAAQNIGDFTLTGREGLSATPEEQLAGGVSSSPLASIDNTDSAQADEWLAANSEEAVVRDVNNIVEAQTWRYGNDGQVILAAHANQTYSPVFSGFTCNAL